MPSAIYKRVDVIAVQKHSRCFAATTMIFEIMYSLEKHQWQEQLPR
jgi:hypothetical protein